ncbi:MAG: ASCH domain-containing protein [Canidatus Methanoxibalbensis ujae]|nr:ASCH domain-containing protein [Candidatus Methanoxibalbensis ujae]MCW7077970.1 ASCH domain-containing protein [Candidatus Methanoxibalbensis ujae]
MKRLNFDSKYMKQILRGEKTTTVRKGIRRKYDTGDIIELIADKKPFAIAEVKAVEVKRLRDISISDAIQDGFSSREDLINALRRIYGKMKEEEFVTIIHFKILR